MGNSVLLGDSGYPLKKYLITPILNPVSPVQDLFNTAQIRTRNVVERTFGIWKRRFPVLSVGLRNKIQSIQTIIVATTILQNIAQDQQDFLPEEQEDIENIPENAEAEQENHIVNHRQPFLEYFVHLL